MSKKTLVAADGSNHAFKALDVAGTINDPVAGDGVHLMAPVRSGIGPVKKLLIGSVATRVTLLAKCPCLNVR